MSTYTDDALFEHESPSPELIDAIESQPGSYVARRADGWRLGWHIVTIGGNKGQPKTQRVNVVWFDQENQPQTSTGIATDIITPVVRIGGLYIRVPEDVFKFETNAERVHQSVVIDTKNTEQCPNAKAFFDDMDQLFTVDLANFLVDRAEDHDLLNESDRVQLEEDGPEAMKKALLRYIRDPMNKSFHMFHYEKPKRKILSVRRFDPKAGKPVKILPKDAEILNTEPFERIKQFIDSSASYWSLSLVKILLPDGKTVVRPDQYSRLERNNAFATMTISLFGINRRDDGQHSVMACNSGVRLITNGARGESSGPTIDLMAMRRKRPQPAAAPAEPKRAHVDTEEYESE